MITCDRCNTENLDGSQYCDECGVALRASPVARAGAAEDGAEALGGVAARPAVGRGEQVGGPVEAQMASHADAPVRASAAPYAAGREKPVHGMQGLSVVPYAKLVIHRGRSVGKEFPLSEDEIHIGRWDADGGIFPDVDLDADDPEAKVSRRHARIVRRNGQCYLEDLGSTNGTFINRGKRLLPGDRQPLHDGDEIIFGKTFLRFKVIE